MSADTTPSLLTLSEAAHLLRCSWRTIRRLTRLANGISSVKIGRRVMVPYDDLALWLNRNLRRPPVEAQAAAAE